MVYESSSAQVEATFTNQAGEPADPSGLLYSLVDPTGQLTTFDQTAAQVVHVGPGLYVLATPPLSPAGTWVWQVESTGAQPRITGGVLSVYLEPVDELPATALARARLSMMVDADADPVLSADELETLLQSSARVDEFGNAPSDELWSPTYALGVAAAEGWTWKAGRVAGRVDIADEAAKLSRSQMQAAFLRMAQLYRARPMSAVLLHRPLSYMPVDYAVPEGLRALLPGAQGPLHLGPPYISPTALPGAEYRGDNTA